MKQSLTPFVNHGCILLMAVLLVTGCGGTTPARPQTSDAPSPAVDAKSGGTAAENTPPPIDPAVTSAYDHALKAMQNQRFDEAEAILLGLVKDRPDYAGLYANIGILMKRKGDLEQAERAFKKALELNSQNADVYNHLAILYREQGKFDLAQQTYEAGLKIAPEHVSLNLNLGILLDLYLNNPQNALEYFQTAQKLSPEDKQIQIWLADIQKRLIAKH